jgi:hydroxyethylthiazole kinase
MKKSRQRRLFFGCERENHKMQRFAESAGRHLAAVRERRPLIHNITNLVVMNFTANALLAMGASPVMAHAAGEVEEMASLARALVLNIGTLTEEWVDSMLRAGRAAAAAQRPIVLDPVGAGATRLRTRSALRIAGEVRPQVIRGNPSEILALAGEAAAPHGVDSSAPVDRAATVAGRLAGELGTAIAVTGAVDLVTDGRRTVRVRNGHMLLGRVTGTGCAATAAIGAFLAVDPEPVAAAAGALAFFGLAGEAAARRAAAPGSFMIALLDSLYTITPEELGAGARIEPE